MNRPEIDKQNMAILKELQKLPNVGPATAEDLVLLGITEHSHLKGRNPDELYAELSAKTGQKQDPCVRDVFESIVWFAEGNPSRPWWHFTEGRKERDRKAGKK
jgi:hypothetical protein